MICRNCPFNEENKNNPKVVVTGYHQIGSEWDFRLSNVCAVTGRLIEDENATCDCEERREKHKERLAAAKEYEEEIEKEEQRKQIVKSMAITETDHPHLRHAYPLFRCGRLNATQKREIKEALSYKKADNAKGLYAELKPLVPGMRQLIKTSDNYYFNCHTAFLRENANDTIFLFFPLGKKRTERLKIEGEKETLIVAEELLQSGKVEELKDFARLFKLPYGDVPRALSSRVIWPRGEVIKVNSCKVHLPEMSFNYRLDALLDIAERGTSKIIIAHAKART